MNDKIDKVIELLEQAKVLLVEVEDGVRFSTGVNAMPVTSLNLTKNKVRFENVCANADIITIGDLLKLGKTKFLRFRDVGNKTIDEVSDALEQLGVCW